MSAKQDHGVEGLVASGVQALIDRLREQGIEAGRQNAEKTVADAEARARWVVEQAQEETTRMREQAQAEADRTRTAGQEALQIAVRDALLAVKTDLTQRFAHEIRRLVSDQLKSEDMLQQMILEVAGRSREAIGETEPATVILPRDVVGLNDLRRKPEEMQEGTLAHFVLATATDLMREGVTFGVSEDEQTGIRVRLEGSELTLDLTDEAVANLLLQHLSPRFRALLEGIVK